MREDLVKVLAVALHYAMMHDNCKTAPRTLLYKIIRQSGVLAVTGQEVEAAMKRRVR